jgi:hypothetical protein
MFFSFFFSLFVATISFLMDFSRTRTVSVHSPLSQRTSIRLFRHHFKAVSIFGSVLDKQKAPIQKNSFAWRTLTHQ